VTWAPEPTDSGAVYASEIAFKALEEVSVLPTGLRVSPPRLLSFSVDECRSQTSLGGLASASPKIINF